MAKKKINGLNLKEGALLIEILIAISISAIIGTIAFVGISSQMVKVRDAKIKSNLIQMRSPFDQYYDDAGCFPEELPACGGQLKNGEVIYIKKFPCLENNNSYRYETNNPPHDNRDGEKQNNSCPSWYKILVNLEDVSDKSIDFIGCRKGCGTDCKYNFGISSTNMPINDGCPQYDTYACTPSGKCEQYTNPGISNCPTIFRDDPTCQNKCNIKDNRCKNESGKKPSG